MSQEKNRVPADLLTWSADKRLEFFTKTFIRHPKLEEAHNQLMNILQTPGERYIIFIVGPTGVGKTTVRRGVEKEIVTRLMPDLERNPGRLAYVSTEVVGPEPGRNFPWRDLYERILTNFGEILIDEKILMELTRLGIHSLNGQFVIDKGIYIPNLRRALELCLKHRCPQGFFFDEAQHFSQVSGSEARKKQMDTLKSLLSHSNIDFGLFGNYELLECWGLSGQLNRRTQEVHFSRYLPDSKEDIKAFKNILKDFQRLIPLRQKPDLCAEWQLLYERSAGCVGILKRWLDRAVNIALKEDKDSLTLKHLQEQALPARKLLEIAREIEDGEKKFKETEMEVADLRLKLGMGKIPAEKSKNGRTEPKPFRRNPERDEVETGES